MIKKIGLIGIISLIGLILTGQVFAQSGIKFGTFTPAPTEYITPETPGVTRGAGGEEKSKTELPQIDCVTDYRPGGNNVRSKSQVYGMLLKKYKSGSLSDRFSAADEDIITMAQMNYRLFGRLPDTDNRTVISEIVKSAGPINSANNTNRINYFYMKGYLRFEGILGENLSEVEQNLAKLSCEARIDQVRRKSSSPIRVFPPYPLNIKVKIENKILGGIRDFWEFRAYPNGKLRLGNGELVKEIPFDYELFGNYKPKEGILVKGKFAESEKFAKLIEKLNLGFIKEDILSLFGRKVPEANYYFVSIFPREEANKALRWDITPEPDREYKYIFYIRPYVKNPVQDLGFRIQKEIPKKVIEGIRFEKKGLAVLDYNVFVDL